MVERTSDLITSAEFSVCIKAGYTLLTRKIYLEHKRLIVFVSHFRLGEEGCILAVV